jgi:transcriptional regulator with XRE-family HTH domain|tara:strand:- start:72 stop:335 length:264 start_codon:yes stop_codon:yes gene_type:complete
VSWYAEKLRRLRLDQGISLQELSDKSCHAKSYVSQVERGKRTPSFEVVEQLANALGAKVYIQLEEPEPPPAIAPKRRKKESIVSRFL